VFANRIVGSQLAIWGGTTRLRDSPKWDLSWQASRFPLAPSDGWPSEGDKRDSKGLNAGWLYRGSSERNTARAGLQQRRILFECPLTAAWFSVGRGLVVLFDIWTAMRRNRSASEDYFAPEPASGTRPGGRLITSLQKPTLCRRRR